MFTIDLAGILAHEAIGHTTEADLVLGGSVAGDNINSQIASPLISLVDFANLNKLQYPEINKAIPLALYSLLIKNSFLKFIGFRLNN